jgi:hypothetical protein
VAGLSLFDQRAVFGSSKVGRTVILKYNALLNSVERYTTFLLVTTQLGSKNGLSCFTGFSESLISFLIPGSFLFRHFCSHRANSNVSATIVDVS